MFKPVEMVRVIVQVLHSDAAKVTHVIAKQGLLHLLDSQKFSKSLEKVGGEAFQDLITRFAVLEQELSNIFTRLSIERELRKDVTVEPDQEIVEIEKTVLQIQAELTSISEQIVQIEKQREAKEQRLRLLKAIAQAVPDLEIVRKFSYFYKAIGLMATKDIHRFQASLSGIRHILVPLAIVEHRSLLLFLCSQKDQDALNRALTSAYVERVELPDISQGKIETIIAQLEMEVAQLAERRAQLDKEFRDTHANVLEKLQIFKEKVSLALLILRAQLYYGKGARSYIIIGWVPKRQILKFQEKVWHVTDGRARFDISAPEIVQEVKQGFLNIPVLVDNPYLIRPFEAVVFSYGIQTYKELDVTPIAAFSFLLMFGMMFGDVGHGLIIFLLGYWAFKKFAEFADIGMIAMESGIAAAFFGLLYGSIFGVEHWLPALWLHPAQEIGTLMGFAVGLGIVMISAGVILNIVNSFRRADYENGWLGHYGVVGGVFYWMCIILALKYVIQGQGVSTGAVLGFLGVPLGVIFFKEPLGHLWFKKHDGEGKLFPSGIGLFVMEAVIEVMDVVIRYLGNTVSFIRTAAFALAHGGLAIAVFALANIVAELKGGGLWYWIAILLGNVLIIALEGLVVSIQTIRLEYYEFFTKFFKGGGEQFKPLRIE